MLAAFSCALLVWGRFRQFWPSLLVTAGALVWLSMKQAGNPEGLGVVRHDFVEGFEAGVRYGLIAQMQNPQEDDIRMLTEKAKRWYWLVVVDGGKSLQKEDKGK